MKDMSEEKEFCKHDTHESHYCGDCHKELLAAKDAEIKSLESRLKEAEKKNKEIEDERFDFYATPPEERKSLLDRIKDLEQRLSQAEAELKLQEKAWNTIADKNATLKSILAREKEEVERFESCYRLTAGDLAECQVRLSQAEAELDAVVKERDLYNEKYLELEKELSDFKKFHDEEFFGWEKLTSNLKVKLSQAENQNTILHSQLNAEADFQALFRDENQSLKNRLANSWEKRTVEEIEKALKDSVEQFNLEDGGYPEERDINRYLALDLVKFMEEKRI